MTPLHWAAQNDNGGIIKVLLAVGADKKALNKVWGFYPGAIVIFVMPSHIHA